MSIETEIHILCENIRRLRKLNEISKTKMAKLLGISTRSLAMIEKDILPKNLCCDILFNIQNQFQISPASILSEVIPLQHKKQD
ncbi:MAG: helix-turn-helix transcriptional regulator [Clostridia bacterium]|nr:helix-turn-helix transcriptional regulator [Clostridia bacterium]MBP3555092.1 helix-turn-helix transcriptional regulator [Clostridia bacterium]